MLLKQYSEWEALYHIFDQVDNLIKAIQTRELTQIKSNPTRF